MSEQNSNFILENSCKDETDKCLNLNSIQLGFIKDEIPTYLNNDVDEQSFHIEDNIINNVNNIGIENFEIDPVNGLGIKTEYDDNYTGSQNSILIIEDSLLLKSEIDIKNETLTCLNNDESNKTYTKTITVNNVKSNNRTIDTLNANVEIKSENDCENTSIKNSMLVIEDGYSVKFENDSFPNSSSSLLCSTYEENTSFLNNENNISSYHNEKSITNCDKKQNKCDVCQKSFVEKGTLKRHMNVHAVIKPHICHVCQKSYVEKGTLKRHMFIHVGKRPHICDVCQKSFVEKGNLKRHMLTHTNIKPHKCNICQRKFSLKQNLNMHMFTHTSYKLFNCYICQKTFSLKQSLKRHMPTHTDEKPYKI